jgi:hypothetical protein
MLTAKVRGQQRGLLLALSSGYGEERGCFLFHVLTSAVRALHIRFVFLQGLDEFEGFMAVVAEIVVHGHGDLPFSPGVIFNPILLRAGGCAA